MSELVDDMSACFQNQPGGMMEPRDVPGPAATFFARSDPRSARPARRGTARESGKKTPRSHPRAAQSRGHVSPPLPALAGLGRAPAAELRAPAAPGATCLARGAGRGGEDPDLGWRSGAAGLGAWVEASSACPWPTTWPCGASAAASSIAPASRPASGGLEPCENTPVGVLDGLVLAFGERV